MKSETSLTKAELLRVIKVYQDTLFKIRACCDNPERFENNGNVYAAIVGAVSAYANIALGLDD